MVDLAVCLLTCDRQDLTAITVESFIKHNHDIDALLLHADDGSTSGWNFEIAEAGGFETVYSRSRGKRGGQIPALKAVWNEAFRRGAEYILHLENDQEFVAPIPTRRDAQSIRLYGERKERHDGPRAMTGPHIMGTKERIVWMLDGHDWERAHEAHWGGQPSITDAELLVEAVEYARRLKDVSMHLQRIETLRPRENVTWHIGAQRTPGF